MHDRINCTLASRFSLVFHHQITLHGLVFLIKQELKALLDPEFSIITTFLELFG